MSLELRTPDAGGIGGVLDVLGSWQRDDSPLQLHPGDVGWFQRAGAIATAGALRTWIHDGRVVAIGLLDGPDLLRLTVAPDHLRQPEAAASIVADLTEPDRGVLPAGRASVEAPTGSGVDALLGAAGWAAGESWTPLRRDLSAPIEDPAVRVEVVGPDRVDEFTAVIRSSFGSTRFTEERRRAMAAGPAFAEARCLLAVDAAGSAVAAVTAWSAGRGRPGLIEPMGVHEDHRGRGWGRSICLAAARELQRMDASSVLVCTPSTRAPAIATYRSAGFVPLPERLDRTREP